MSESSSNNPNSIRLLPGSERERYRLEHFRRQLEKRERREASASSSEDPQTPQHVSASSASSASSSSDDEPPPNPVQHAINLRHLTFHLQSHNQLLQPLHQQLHAFNQTMIVLTEGRRRGIPSEIPDSRLNKVEHSEEVWETVHDIRQEIQKWERWKRDMQEAEVKERIARDSARIVAGEGLGVEDEQALKAWRKRLRRAKKKVHARVAEKEELMWALWAKVDEWGYDLEAVGG